MEFFSTQGEMADNNCWRQLQEFSKWSLKSFFYTISENKSN